MTVLLDFHRCSNLNFSFFICRFYSQSVNKDRLTTMKRKIIIKNINTAINKAVNNKKLKYKKRNLNKILSLLVYLFIIYLHIR